MTDDEKSAWKARLNIIRLRRWRDKQKKKKQEEGKYKNPRVIDPWMVHLVRRGV